LCPGLVLHDAVSQQAGVMVGIVYDGALTVEDHRRTARRQFASSPASQEIADADIETI
jgi:hypothetical protein